MIPIDNDDLPPQDDSLQLPSFRRDADKGREPMFVSDQLGRRTLSLEALAERIEAAFIAEYRDSPVLKEADTATRRIKLVLEATEYTLSVESVQLSQQEKADLVGKIYSNLFSYSVLDRLFVDERITTISLEGADKASVRYAHGDLVSLGPIFQDENHLLEIIKRLLVDAGADLREDQPYIETGLIVGERRVCINLMMPPVSYTVNVDIRIHPPTQPTLSDLVAYGFMNAQAAELLEKLVKSPHGIVIVGDTESGKTTLVGALLQVLPQPETAVAVERAGELQLPVGMQRLVVKWPAGNEQGISFGEQIGHALELKPRCIILDEVRSDEPQAIVPLLETDDAPRSIWSFRGPADSKRLRSALSMIARRAEVGQGEILVHALYERLPFIVTVKRSQGNIRLNSIAEWQFRTSDFPDYVVLMETVEGNLSFTGQPIARNLNLE